MSGKPDSPGEHLGVRLEGLIARLSPLYRLGWAFLLAWVFCVFYTSSISGYIGGVGSVNSQASLPANIFYSSFPLFVSVLMLIVVVLAEKRYGAPSQHPSLQWLAPLCAALSTPLLFLSLPTPALTSAAFALGAVLTGVGSGILWVMWGEYWCMLDRDEIEFITPACSIVAVLLVLLVENLTQAMGLVLTSLFPIASGVCLFLALRDKRRHPTGADHWMNSEREAIAGAHEVARNSPLASLRSMGRTCFALLAACVFVCILGGFDESADRGIAFNSLVLVLSGAFIMLVASISTRRARRMNLQFLYRWMCPLLVAGFVAVICLPIAGSMVAYGIGIAARMAFCLITQIYFANLASLGRVTPTQSYGLGWISVHLGDWIGVMCIVVLSGPLKLGMLTTTTLSATCILLLVVATMFVLNDDTTFARGTNMLPAEAESGTAEPTGNAEGNSPANFAQRVDAISQQHGLTPRETEILNLLAHGRSIPYIRDELVISKNTAITHVKHIYAKLGVHNKQELLDLVQD